MRANLLLESVRSYHKDENEALSANISLSDPAAGLSEGIEGDEYDNDADNDLLNIRRDVHEAETVEQDPNQDRADDGPENGADAPKRLVPPISADAITVSS